MTFYVLTQSHLGFFILLKSILLLPHFPRGRPMFVPSSVNRITSLVILFQFHRFVP